MLFNRIEIGKVYKPTIDSQYQGYGFMKVVEKMPRDHRDSALDVNLVKVLHNQSKNFDFAIVRWVKPKDLDDF